MSNHITIKNPSHLLLETLRDEIRIAIERETERIFSAALSFLQSDAKGKRTYRARTLSITIQK
jgi:hypothetical protein